VPLCTANGLRFHYQQSGSGPDVVLIHGVTGDLSIWFLCRAMQELGTRFRVTAYDLRGHGYSEAPESQYTSADHAADLLALMDGLGIGRDGTSPAAVVGHSFGGVIALHAAALGPERFASVVLSDPYFPALRHLEDVSRWSHWQSFRQEALEAGVTLSDEHWYDLGRFFDQVTHLDDEGLRKFRQAVGLPALNRLLRLGRTSCGHDTKVEAGLTAEMIRTMDRPTLALYGEFSPFLATAHYLTAHLPRCRSAIVPGAKHRAPEENPEGFLRLLAAFLDESVGSPEEGGRPLKAVEK
jgi:pimeloyl-ACP methyl ester carboxylesterase